MKQFVLTRTIFYFVFFILFFILTVFAVNNNGWTFIAVLNAGIATIDFVRAVKLFGIYIKMRNNEKK
ncbi:MAG: hypothetical protein Q4F26_03195 [Atopococcus tabaci]|uniref:DUF4305 domain-containing protein n=1 Tax=Atopococcus tabaci TaxID=269774 RepID=A0AA43UC93_9LACT|nr:hypothetical protein [Atopococcus tabaci]